MKIKVTGDLNHNVYGRNGMRNKLEYGFKELGHEIVEEGEDILIIPGSSANFKHVQTMGKKIWWSHGVNWGRGFANENNETLKDNFDNCELVAYQSEFAKHMVEKAFGKREGPIIFNASVPKLPGNFIKWKHGEEIRIVCCSIWRAWKRLHEIERMVRGLASKGHKIKLSVVGKDHRDDCPFGLPKEGDNFKIEYLGLMNINEMIPIYYQNHVGVHLSFNDYSPASVTEMMASGLPVIVTNSGGSKDVVQDKGGIVINTDPFIDTSFPIHNEGQLPKVDDDKFEKALFEILNNLEEYQKRNMDWVLGEANCVKSAEKFLKL